jgi:hypothetical protein
MQMLLAQHIIPKNNIYIYIYQLTKEKNNNNFKGDNGGELATLGASKKN